MKISYHLFLTIEIVMILFIYDKTLDGLLTALFDAYNRKTFPDVLLSKGDTLPLFYDDIFTVITDKRRQDVSGGDCRRRYRHQPFQLSPGVGFQSYRK